MDMCVTGTHSQNSNPWPVHRTQCRGSPPLHRIRLLLVATVGVVAVEPPDDVADGQLTHKNV